MSHPGGRPTKLTPELTNEAALFVDEELKRFVAPATIAIQIAADKANAGNGDNSQSQAHVLPTVERLALHLGISRSTLDEWVKGSAEFAWVVDRLRLRKADQLQQGGVTGVYNPTIAKLLLSKEGYVERSENTDRLVFDKDDKADEYVDES